MEENTAVELARAWLRQAPGDPDVQHRRFERRMTVVREVLRALVPDPDAWAVLPADGSGGASDEAEGEPHSHMLAVISNEPALYLVHAREAANGTVLGTCRTALPVAGAARVLDSREDVDGADYRHREWSLPVADDEVLTIRTERIMNSAAGDPPEEVFARRLAELNGWHVT